MFLLWSLCVACRRASAGCNPCGGEFLLDGLARIPAPPSGRGSGCRRASDRLALPRVVGTHFGVNVVAIEVETVRSAKRGHMALRVDVQLVAYCVVIGCN